MNILALDLATSTGWALSENDRITSGVQTFDVKRGESPGMRFLRLSRWLEEVAARHHGLTTRYVDLIVYEAAHHRGGPATAVGVGLTSHVLSFCAKHAIEHQPVHTATLKKWTTGKGNAGKPLMVAAVCRRWNVRIDDHNEADAYALMMFALSELVPASART